VQLGLSAGFGGTLLGQVFEVGWRVDWREGLGFEFEGMFWTWRTWF